MARRAPTGQVLAFVVLAAGVAAEEVPATARPAEEETGGEAPVRVHWRDGETVLEAPRARLALTNRLQLRWSRTWPAEDDRLASDSFRVRRARSKLDGWVYTERLTFELEVDWARAGQHLLDAFVDFDAAGAGALRLKVGKFKVPFGRQELATSGKLQFLGRSIVSQQFAHGRQGVGLMLHGDGARGRLSWAAGLFDGSGPASALNDDGRYQFDARVQLAPNGDPGGLESDLPRSTRPLYAFGVQYERNGEGSEPDRPQTTWGGDAALRYRGLFVFGEAFWSRLEPAGGTVVRRSGVALQGGWVYRSVELAGRWARLEGGPYERSESGIALNWYIEGHRLKVQSDLRFLDGGPIGPDDTQLRVQTQLVF